MMLTCQHYQGLVRLSNVIPLTANLPQEPQRMDRLSMPDAMVRYDWTGHTNDPMVGTIQDFQHP